MSVLQQIGKTPLVKLTSSGNSKIYAKLENKNPSGSIKDRIAYRMIKDAEDSGKLKKGMCIIELSSGNTGISLSMVGNELGYAVTIVVPKYATEDSKKRIKSYGGKVIQVQGGMDKCFERVREMIAENPNYYFWPNQASNPVVLKSNEELGKEILVELKNVDNFLASKGSGGTITGVGGFLKKKNPNIQIYLVLPNGPYSVTGVDDKKIKVPLPLFNESIIDHEIRIKEKDAIEAAKRLHRDYGHYVGISSGAVFAAAEKISHRKNGNIVIIFPDSGNRYTHILGGKSL